MDAVVPQEALFVVSAGDVLVGAFFAWLAWTNGRNAWAWFWTGAVLGPFVAVVVFVLLVKGKPGPVLSWQCPDCRLFNEDASRRCPCGYELEPAPIALADGVLEPRRTAEL